MPRYFTAPRAVHYVEDDHRSPDPGPLPCLTVSEHEAVDTGLLDKDGNTIMRAPNPLGFGMDREW